MKLLTRAILKKLPPLYSQDNVSDPMVVCKFFTPDAGWTWFVTEGEKQEDGDFLMFGFVKGLEDELGYFSLNELMKVRGALGLGIERDLHFIPCPLSEITNPVQCDEAIGVAA
jgi:hypothetical protein